MNVLIAPDSFKGSLSAQQVAKAIAKGFKRPKTSLGFHIRELPMADGGEGTLNALASMGGRWQNLNQSIAAGGKKETKILWLDNEYAAIEVAQTVGIEDINDQSPSCLERESGPVGEQIRTLIEKGCQKLTVGLGGSCTSDGGIGLLCEIGLTLFNEQGQAMEPQPKNLQRVHHVAWNPHPLLEDLHISVMCDVENPLCGPQGACAIFGPQKGLSPEDIPIIDAEVLRVHSLISEKTKRHVIDTPGAGAAGGLGAALLVLGAELKSGAEVLFKTLNIEKHLEWADLVVTGEGRSDHQTLQGKLPQKLAERAKNFKCPTLLVSGSIAPESYSQLSQYFQGVTSIADGPISLDDAIYRSEDLLSHAGEMIAQMIGIGAHHS
jgi:glycerate kinase